MDTHFGKINIVIRKKGKDISTTQEPTSTVPDELKQILESGPKTQD